MKPIRAAIVDDHAIVLEGLERVLQLDGHIRVVGVSRSLRDARSLLPPLKPDVILLDLRLPDSQGVDTVSAVRRLCPESRIIVLTGLDVELEAEALRQGADAFLKKELSSDVLVQTINRLFPDRAAPQYEKRLTAREQDVARLAAQGLSNTEIAETLTISENTVKTHLSHVLHKLGLRDRVELAARWHLRSGT